MRTARPVPLFALALLFPGAAFGQTIIQHTGANDPVSAGFSIDPTGSGVAIVGPVFDAPGLDAWSINKTGTGGTYFYRYNLSDQELQLAILSGWSLSGKMRFLEPGVGALRFAMGTHSTFLGIWLRENGDIEISAFGTTEGFTMVGAGKEYFEYTVVFDALDQTAALWVSGFGKVLELPSGSPPEPFIAFGAGQGISHTHWNEVTLTIIPEPATAALLAGAAALLAVGIWRRRRRGRWQT